MAKIIQENLKYIVSAKGQGFEKKPNLLVTDGLLVPALVVEMGFATNSEDKNKLLNLKTQAESTREKVLIGSRPNRFEAITGAPLRSAPKKGAAVTPLYPS